MISIGKNTYISQFSLARAWGINGFFGVISILLATFPAIIYGFKLLKPFHGFYLLRKITGRK